MALDFISSDEPAEVEDPALADLPGLYNDLYLREERIIKLEADVRGLTEWVLRNERYREALERIIREDGKDAVAIASSALEL